MAKQRGFTLLEVLVAVAVLALTMGVFISGSARYADDAGYIQSKTLALWVARNRLVELQLVEPWPDEGREEGQEEMGGREWEWRSEIEASPDPRVRRVEVTVYPILEGVRLEADADPIARLLGYMSPKDGSASGAVDPAALEQLQSQGLVP
mgnify:CR=1 FL=1